MAPDQRPDVVQEAEAMLEDIGCDANWQADHDWRDDGADQVIDAANAGTVAFIATGMDEMLHTARTVFIAAAPRLVRDLLTQLREVTQQRDTLAQVKPELWADWQARWDEEHAKVEHLTAQLAEIEQEMRTMARVAGQAFIEEPDREIAVSDAKLAGYCSRWADQLAALRAGQEDR